MGHFEIDCYHRMDYAYQGRHPPKKLMAMVANQSPIGDQTWYSDTGASHHVTSDLANLSINSEYQGGDKVQVGNGQGLSILHIGSSKFCTPQNSFLLINILHCPFCLH